MMMWKTMMNLLLVLFLSIQTSFAKEVTVEGLGINRESAVNDAMRMAVEQVVGTFIDSNTLAVNLMIELDEIYKKSRGYVKSIKIVNEQETTNGYRVRAIIDVDSDPNSKLMNNLTMLYMLNDPRIAVIILKNSTSQDEQSDPHATTVEAAMNAKLISMGFSHVVDANQIIRLKNPQMLNDIYNGNQSPTDAANADNSVEYLVLGKIRADVKNVQVPGYGSSEMTQTSLLEAKANLEMRIIKYSTGDLVGNFVVTGQGMDSSSSRAEDKALQSIAERAAVELDKTFRKFASKSTAGLQIIVSCSDYNKIEQLRKDLLGVSGVQNVYIREHSDNKTVLELESTQKAHIIVQLLMKHTKLGIFVESVNDSLIKMNVN
ncbi:MAG: hypothetical protein IJ563_12090 [Selenomonadaceae bacterium]|nr:hypothetical protein [Selenomonadaceae bacterium]